MRRTEVNRLRNLLHAQRLKQVMIHIADRPRDAVIRVLRSGLFTEQQQTQQAVKNTVGLRVRAECVGNIRARSNR